MPHKFNPDNISRLDNPERRKNLPPGKLLLELGLEQGDIFADLGAGSGYFSFPALKIVGKDGFIYAFDISEKMIEKITQQTYSLGDDFKNFKAMLITENSIPLPESHLDFILASQVLHETSDLESTVKEMKRVLKKSGKLAIIEWSHLETPDCGPPAHDRLKPEQLINILEKLDFDKISYNQIGGFYYSISADKK